MRRMKLLESFILILIFLLQLQSQLSATVSIEQKTINTTLEKVDFFFFSRIYFELKQMDLWVLFYL